MVKLLFITFSLDRDIYINIIILILVAINSWNVCFSLNPLSFFPNFPFHYKNKYKRTTKKKFELEREKKQRPRHSDTLKLRLKLRLCKVFRFVYIFELCERTQWENTLLFYGNKLGHSERTHCYFTGTN